jgi:hypothetical protein
MDSYLLTLLFSLGWEEKGVSFWFRWRLSGLQKSEGAVEIGGPGIGHASIIQLPFEIDCNE